MVVRLAIVVECSDILMRFVVERMSWHDVAELIAALRARQSIPGSMARMTEVFEPGSIYTR